MEQVSLLVKADNLAACSEAGIDSKDTLLSYRRSKKKLAQIFSEYPYRFYIGLFLGFLDYFIGD